MGQRSTRYKIADEDGEAYLLEYIDKWCMCCGNCYEDELLLWDEGDDPDKVAPYRMECPGWEFEHLISGLLDGTVTATRVKSED